MVDQRCGILSTQKGGGDGEGFPFRYNGSIRQLGPPFRPAFSAYECELKRRVEDLLCASCPSFCV